MRERWATVGGVGIWRMILWLHRPTLASTNPSGRPANPGIVIQLSITHGGGNSDIAKEEAERYQLVMMTMSMKTIAKALKYS